MYMGQSISSRIVETQRKEIGLIDTLEVENAMLNEYTKGTSEYTEQHARRDRVAAELATAKAELATLQAAEGRLAYAAQPVDGDGGSVIGSRARANDNLLGKLALCMYESRVTGSSAEAVAARRFGNSHAVETIIKAAQNPAMTNVPGYAQELTRQSYGQFLDLLKARAILPQCTPAANIHSFDGANSIWVPTRLGGSAPGTWRAEGSPIPVKGLTFDHILLTPKNLGVILTATQEMLRRSAIDLASYFQNAITQDTGKALDALFISNTAGTAISPAGARNALDPTDTRASTGANAAQITNDIKLMVKKITSHDMGDPATTRWLMHPANLIAVAMLLTATGSKQFPEAESGRLAGYPVVTSTQMDPAIVLLIDFSNYTFGIGVPQFRVSEDATIHEDSAPLPISTGTSGAGALTAAPVRSLYQTNSWALRMMLDADWAKLRPIGPVQELTACAW